LLKGNGSTVLAATAGTDYLLPSNNLSDLVSASMARANLGLGTSATYAASSSATPNTVALRDAEGSAAFASDGAFAAVQGINSSTGSGLYGDATSGKGVEAISGSGTAIYGYSFAGDLMQLEGNAGVVVTVNQDGDVTATSFSGDGSGLTGLNVTRTLADQAEVDAATPDFFGQLGIKADTGNLLQAVGTTAGDWLGNFTFNDIDTGSILASGTITGTNITATGDVIGNAETATALQTARTIFNQSFNGTGNIDGNLLTTGHLASVPSGGEAGHLITLNGTAPTVVAGRSAWWSDGSGVPSFRNGTGSAVTLLRSSDLGTNVATFLATPTSANLAAAVTGETGTGSLVFATSPTLTTPILGTPTSGTLTNCTGYPELALAGVVRAITTSSLVRAAGVSGVDSALSIALDSGRAYRIRGLIKIVGQTGGTLSSNLGGPNCSSENVLGIRPGANFNIGSSNLTPYTSLALHNATGSQTQQVMFDGVIITTAAGNLTFSWVSTGAAATRATGCYIEATPLN
jgi:hypothetical protein